MTIKEIIQHTKLVSLEFLKVLVIILVDAVSFKIGIIAVGRQRLYKKKGGLNI